MSNLESCTRTNRFQVRRALSPLCLSRTTIALHLSVCIIRESNMKGSYSSNQYSVNDVLSLPRTSLPYSSRKTIHGFHSIYLDTVPILDIFKDSNRNIESYLTNRLKLFILTPYSSDMADRSLNPPLCKIKPVRHCSRLSS